MGFVIELDPKDASIFINLGVSENYLERYEEAIEAFDKAIKLDPKNSESFNKRGLVKVSLKRSNFRF